MLSAVAQHRSFARTIEAKIREAEKLRDECVSPEARAVGEAALALLQTYRDIHRSEATITEAMSDWNQTVKPILASE